MLQVGEVTDNDLVLAKEFDGVVYAFNTRVLPSRAKTAEQLGVKVKEFNIIYKLVDDLKDEIRLALLYKYSHS